MKQETAEILETQATCEQVHMEPQEISIEVLIEKYAKNGEITIPEVRRRVAKALASVEAERKDYWEEVFFNNLENGFVPAGRINSAAGMDLHATLINCFVQPVGDCITGFDSDGYPSIYTALAESAETMRRGGGVGYDFSRIRPAHALVKGTQSRASGPLSYMRVFDRSCETVESAGARRGAQMGVLRCDHPDIFDFVGAKSQKGMFNNFNLSIGVTDKFMQAVVDNGTWDLIHKIAPTEEYINTNKSYYDEKRGVWVWKTIQVSELWELVMKSTYNHAEPGILFLDQMNRENNLYYCETIEATNPCAEQPLPPYGCCCLGSINLTKFVRNPFSDCIDREGSVGRSWFDFEAFEKSVEISVRMLDNVLNATEWPLDKQYQEAMNKRRIGLGFLGIGDAMLMLGINYDREDGVTFARNVSEAMRNAAYRTSIELAKEKGAFPMLDVEKYLAGNFIARLPEDIKQGILENGIRNSHLLSIAPTGTITLAFADNASNGIEPPFSWTYTRKKRMDDNTWKEYEVADHAWRLYREMGGDMENLPKHFVTALSMDVGPHVDVMNAVQPYCDTSISKTVNIPADYPYEKFKDLYVYAWKLGLKGLATYRPNDVLGSVLSVKEEKPVEKLSVAPVVEEHALSGMTIEEIVADMYRQPFESREDGPLPGISTKGRFLTADGEQKFIMTINFMELIRETEHGPIVIRRPVEFLLTSNFTTASSAWDMAMRFMSLMARSGVSMPKVIENMREITWEHGNVKYGRHVKDGRSVPKWHPSDVAAMGYLVEETLKSQGYLNEDGSLAMQYSIAGKHVGLGEIAASAKAEVTLMVDEDKKDLPRTGKLCKECGAYNVVKRDGCEICESCGTLGSCG